MDLTLSYVKHNANCNEMDYRNDTSEIFQYSALGVYIISCPQLEIVEEFSYLTTCREQLDE